MGIPSRTLSRQQLASAGLQRLASGHVRKQLRHCLAGYAWWRLDGAPPTVTHHDKRIEQRGGHQTLVDSPKLQAARRWYLDRLPERAELVPLRPPYALRVEWRWALPADRDAWPDHALPGSYHQEKPDLDNLMKLVKDLLALRGWLVDDAMVAKDGGSEKRWCREGEQPGVTIFARTLASPADSGATIRPAPGEKPNTLHVAPWTTDADVAAFAAMRNPEESPIEPAPRMSISGGGNLTESGFRIRDTGKEQRT
jgi:Holliday junction resolvase RusA-like endonuclease